LASRSLWGIWNVEIEPNFETKDELTAQILVSPLPDVERD
jgi:hypothetical protein